MRGRTILILLAVLVVLAGLATVIEQGRNRKTHLKGAQLIPGYKTELVDRIRFRGEGKTVELEKKGNEWVVTSEGGFSAEKKLVDDILEAMRKATADEVVSTNPANQSLFMADSSGAEVWIHQQGKEIAHLYIGKPGPDMLSTYVRSAKSDRVILAPGYLPSLFQSRDTWRQRTLISVKPEDVTRYEYVSPSHGELLLTKNDAGIWRMEKPDTGRVEAGRLSFPLRIATNLKAEGFADDVDPATTGLDADTTRIRIGTADGTIFTVQIGRSAKEGRSYVRLEGRKQIYTMARGRIQSMMMPASGLR